MRDDMMTYKTYGYLPNHDGGSNYVDTKGYYLVTDVVRLCTASGVPYLKCKLKNTDSVTNAICFDYQGDLGDSDNGRVVYVEGKMDTYKGAPQIKLYELRPVDDSDAGKFEMRELLRHGMYAGKAGLRAMREAIKDNIEDTDYRRLCEKLIEEHADVLATCPASIDCHHSAVGGLATHSYEVAGWAQCIAEYYIDEYGYTIDMDLLCAGALLHDIGKVKEYCCDSNGLAVLPSGEGKMNNHAMNGAMMVWEAAQKLNIPKEKTDKLFNMIASHHSSPRFANGMQPQTPEAKLLALIDNMESCVDNCFGKNITFRDGKPTAIHTYCVA